MEKSDKIRLTQTVQKGGCAAKVAAVELRKILAQVDFPPRSPDLLIGSETFDDAAILRVSDDLALVQTLDFFTPIVDDPFLFGQVAAANALSDVYAMGGTPKTAMAIMAFPVTSLESSVATAVLQGACRALNEAGTSLVGGHTIDDDTLKFGLSVSGWVHPQEVWSNAQAQPGDHLILTKALGTGTATAALKRSEVTESQIQDVLDSMAKVNCIPQLLSSKLRRAVHAATDITGFGLAGHAWNMARASQISIEIEFAKVPVFSRALEFIQRGFLTKAHRTNREYAGEHIRWGGQSPEQQALFFDPQTSGGLLLSVSPQHSDEILDILTKQFPRSTRIGTVRAQADAGLIVK